MKTYVGDADGRTVRVTGGAVDGPLDPRLDLRNHSPDGFAWGYSGSGPAQLALALLADHLGNNGRAAVAYYQEFKRRLIATLDTAAGWTLTARDVAHWLAVVGYVESDWRDHVEPMPGADEDDAMADAEDDERKHREIMGDPSATLA